MTNSAPFSASQILAVPSPDAVTTRRPDGEKAADTTALSCPRNVAIRFPLFAFQSRAVLSMEAVTNLCPSGEKAASNKSLSCPRSTASSAPVSCSRYRSRLIPGRGDNLLAIAGKCCCKNRIFVSAQHFDLYSGTRVPNDGGVISRCRQDHSSVGREHRGINLTEVVQDSDLHCGLRIPNSRGAIPRCGNHATTIG